MRCQNCGTENQSGNFCIKCCSKLEYPQVSVDKPPLFTVVMALICFSICWPLGLASTILMVQSRDAFFTGDIPKFNSKDKASRICSIVGLILTAIGIFLYFAMFIILGFALAD